MQQQQQAHCSSSSNNNMNNGMDPSAPHRSTPEALRLRDSQATDIQKQVGQRLQHGCMRLDCRDGSQLHHSLVLVLLTMPCVVSANRRCGRT